MRRPSLIIVAISLISLSCKVLAGGKLAKLDNIDDRNLEELALAIPRELLVQDFGVKWGALSIFIFNYNLNVR